MCASRADRSATISAGRKTQILEAAKQVFSIKGFSQSSTAEIAEKAGVSQGTIFYYYPTKYDLLIALVDQYLSLELMTDKLNARPGGDLRKTFRGVMEERLTIGFENTDLMLLVLTEMQRDQQLLEAYSNGLIKPVLKNLEAFLCSVGVAKENPKTGRLVARFFMALIIGLVLLRKAEGEEGLLAKTDPDEIAETVTRIVLDGMGVPRGPGEPCK